MSDDQVQATVERQMLKLCAEVRAAHRWDKIHFVVDALTLLATVIMECRKDWLGR